MHDDEHLEQPDRYVPGALPSPTKPAKKPLERSEEERSERPSSTAGPKLTEQLRAEQAELRERRREAAMPSPDEPSLLEDTYGDVEPVVGGWEAVAFVLLAGSGAALSIWLTLELVRQILG